MTHYFLYIKAGVQLDENTHFYKVGIGESDAGMRMHAWIEAYAAEHGHFFCRWSQDATEFYCKCIDSIGHNAQLIQAIPAADLKKVLRTGCEDPECYYAILNRHKMMMAIDPHYYTYYELSKRNSAAHK